jgi:hypothetical protein
MSTAVAVVLFCAVTAYAILGLALLMQGQAAEAVDVLAPAARAFPASPTATSRSISASSAEN